MCVCVVILCPVIYMMCVCVCIRIKELHIINHLYGCLLFVNRHADSVHAGTLPTETPTLNSTNEQDTT